MPNVGAPLGATAPGGAYVSVTAARGQRCDSVAVIAGALTRKQTTRSGTSSAVASTPSSSEQDEMERVLRERAQQRLAAILAAISRLDNGTYGECAACRRPISYGRLTVMPEATLCIACGGAGASGRQPTFLTRCTVLRLRDIMTKDVLTVSPEMSLRDVMAMLATRHVSGAPVVDGGQVVGVISSTDLLEVAASEPSAPLARAQAAKVNDNLTVAAVMTRTVVSLRPGMPVTEAARHMRSAGVHRVLVMHGNRLLGIVTTKDIANAVADSKLTERKYISLPHAAIEAPGWQ